MKKPPDALTAPNDCHSLQVFRFVFHSPRRGSPLATAPRSGAGNLKLAKVLRFRARQHGGTYEARPAFDAVLPWSQTVAVGLSVTTATLMIVALLSPANAQFWGDLWGWGGRQQQRQQPYNPFGGSWSDRPGGFWGDRQMESPRYPRQKERVRETEREEPPDYSRAPPSSPRKDATVKIVVMGDANADWLAYGLEDAFSENTDIGIVRRHRTESGLIRYDQRRDTEWPQAAREIIAAEKPRYIVMMVGNNDRQPIREKISPAAPATAARLNTQPGKAGSVPAGSPSQSDLERQASGSSEPHTTSRRSSRAKLLLALGSSVRINGNSVT